MVLFELHNEMEDITCKTYENMFELRFVIYKLCLELHEVIQIFSTPEFLGNSASKGSDENAVQ
jgi:hypothetical protein